MRHISILGSTGSIGTQTLDVVREHGDIKVSALSCGRNIKLLEKQAREFKPSLVSVWDKNNAEELRVKLADTDIKVSYGMEGLIESATIEDADMIVTAIVGMLGIRPTIAAIKAKKAIALANKETLVTAGHIIIPLAKEYGVPVKIARLTQTFGAGVSAEDNRVFAQFARSIIEGNDIVLHTKGESAKPYCYTTDCVSGILHILLKGKDGEAYNVANQDTYISIKDMALFLKENFNSNIDVIVEEHPEMGYAPVTRLNLLSEKLMSLGWKPSYNLYEMFERLINSLKEDGKKC